MKTVLITGASRGIGRACALRFGAAGYRVLVHFHTQKEKAEKVCEEIKGQGGAAIPVCCDLKNTATIRDMMAQIEKSTGGVDVLVNNAGIAQCKMLCDTTEEDYDTLFGTNVKGMIALTKLVLPHMVHQKSGHIVNLSSIWGITGASCEVLYSASKAAVIGFTKALSKELGPSGIFVNCVAPGVIHTDMNATLSEETLDALKEETPLGTLGTPDDVADAVFYLCHQNRFTTGQILSPNGGMVV